MNDNRFRQEKQQADTVAKEILQYTEKALKDCFKSFYESTRISSDIKAADTKLKSLIAIRDTIAHNPSKPAAAFEDISRTISELQADMKKKRNDQYDFENRLVSLAKEVINKIVQLTEQRCGSFGKMYADSVKEFKTNVNQELEKQMTEALKDIQSLKENKLDIADVAALKEEFTQVKKKMVDFTKRTIEAVSGQIDQSAAKQRTFLEETKKELDPVKIAAKAEATVMARLNTRLEEKERETLRKVKTENEEALKAFPGRIADAVQKEIAQQVGPVNLQKIIEGLPDYKSLKTLSEKLVALSGDREKQKEDSAAATSGETAAATAAAAAVLKTSQESIKQSIQQLSAELTQLKQKTDSTRSIVETLRTRGVPNSSDALQKFDQLAEVKHVEEMQRQIELMHNNIKIIEPVLKMRAQAIEDKMNAMQSNDITLMDDSRKRPRTEDGVAGTVSRETSSDATSNAAVLKKILEIDAKHQNLMDFLLQYKETVLNDTFPARLEAALNKIEQVLRNHETFISFLIDPFTTAKKVQSLTLPEASSSNTANDALNSLNPAMLDAINQLVKRTAEEISLPLQKKIKLLEEKLEAKERNSNNNPH